jgi:hypothetical protein
LPQILLKVARRLNSNQRKFIAEVIGTFIVVVFATGSVVIDAKMHEVLGVPFIAFAPFVGVAICVYLFGKISMAQFNPAVTVGFMITRHIVTVIQDIARKLHAQGQLKFDTPAALTKVALNVLCNQLLQLEQQQKMANDVPPPATTTNRPDDIR